MAPKVGSTSPAPAWARSLVASVCRRYRVRRPTLAWHTSACPAPPRAASDLGVYWQRVGFYDERAECLNLYAYASGSHQESRLTLLHELAHHVTYLREGVLDHPAIFWHYCWRIYFQYHVPLHEAILSEFAYLASARPSLFAQGIRLSPRALAAAGLGEARRRETWLQVRLQNLRSRLLSEKPKPALTSRLRSLKVQRAVASRAVLRHSRAYKRVARSR